MNSAINTGSAMIREEYSGIAKFFHWAVAAAVLTMIPIALIMGNLPDESTIKGGLYDTHKVLGLIVLGLMTLRLLYRLVAGAPAPEPTITALQRVASATVHWALYVLVIVQALLGWGANSAFGEIKPFGAFNVPRLVGTDMKLAEQLFAAHNIVGYTIAALVLLHISAALYHYFIRRDGVLQRMT
jgi:cytochrome b561